MAKKALKKKKRQKNIIFKIALIVFAVAVSTELISLQVSIASKKRENETMEQKVAQQMKENEELQALIDGGMDPAYAERIAREKLGYVAPNERVFVDVNGE
ncbi:MAG: septum formation initiator family protein [Massilioclostridium sp.]|nr:septum formation initiator family protein [Massilioclostridium sp.]